jgi:hypothetical protein
MYKNVHVFIMINYFKHTLKDTASSLALAINKFSDIFLMELRFCVIGKRRLTSSYVLHPHSKSYSISATLTEIRAIPLSSA